MMKTLFMLPVLVLMPYLAFAQKTEVYFNKEAEAEKLHAPETDISGLSQEFAIAMQTDGISQKDIVELKALEQAYAEQGRELRNLKRERVRAAMATGSMTVEEAELEHMKVHFVAITDLEKIKLKLARKQHRINQALTVDTTEFDKSYTQAAQATSDQAERDQIQAEHVQSTRIYQLEETISRKTALKLLENEE